MNIRILFIAFLVTSLSWSQKNKNCESLTIIKDSLGVLKSLPDYLVHEKKFGSKEEYLFLSLANSDETPFLKFQFIQKNNVFIKALCLDQNSKLYIQLANGKIVTLIYVQEESCGNLIYLDDRKINSRVTTGNFLFMKGSFEDLKSSTMTLIRLKNSFENMDFIIKSNYQSELTKEILKPENYFIDYLKCVE